MHDHDALVAAARAALFDLFGDASVPPQQLQRELQLLAQLLQLQLRVLAAESANTTP